MNKVMVRADPLVLSSDISVRIVFLVVSEKFVDLDALVEIVQRFLNFMNYLVFNENLIYKASVLSFGPLNSVHVKTASPNFIKDHTL